MSLNMAMRIAIYSRFSGIQAIMLVGYHYAVGDFGQCRDEPPEQGRRR